MPKAFLLTNKRYNIWKQIKDKFREEQRRRQSLEFEQRQQQTQPQRLGYDVCKHDNDQYHNVPNIDTTTDYSKYTNSADGEGKDNPPIPSPAVSPTSSTTSLNTSSAEDSDGGYSYTTENRPVSPSIEFGLGCRQPNISFLYELMTINHAPTTPYKEATLKLSHDQNRFKSIPDHPHLSHQMYSPLHEIINRPLQQQLSSDQSNLGDNYVCLDCGKRYSTSSNLARHRQTHRASTDKKARKCPHCDKMYVSMPAYSMHVRTHNQGCECKYCGKCFSRPWLLQGHIRTHTGEKPFNCPTCNKSFADKSNLRAHIQTHSSEKPFICGRCGKAFALKSYLYKHEESSCMRGQRFKN